ncbi:MAG: YceD family protein [Parabacteroides sp.]
MGKLDLYSIDLKNLAPGVHEFKYFLEDKFFLDVEGDLVQKGEVEVVLNVQRSSTMFELNFQLDGTVIVPCDLCLDDVEIPVQSENRLLVKFGKTFAEESDEVVVVPEEDGTINVAWFMYEFIALAVPMRHVHAPGACNPEMAGKLQEHTAKGMGEGDGESQATDPRWDALKSLMKNDNN